LRKHSFIVDTRGATLVEYIVVLGCVGLFALAGFRIFGPSVAAKSTSQAECVNTLAQGCSRAEDEDGPVTGAAAAEPQASSSSASQRAVDWVKSWFVTPPPPPPRLSPRDQQHQENLAKAEELLSRGPAGRAVLKDLKDSFVDYAFTRNATFYSAGTNQIFFGPPESDNVAAMASAIAGFSGYAKRRGPNPKDVPDRAAWIEGRLAGNADAIRREADVYAELAAAGAVTEPAPLVRSYLREYDAARERARAANPRAPAADIERLARDQARERMLTAMRDGEIVDAYGTKLPDREGASWDFYHRDPQPERPGAPTKKQR
jgi:pilus assembly protein Flp/PilA